MISDELVKYTAMGMRGINQIVDVLLLSAYLLTYAENIAFFFYILYLPYLLVKKGIEFALKLILIACIILVLVEVKWIIAE